MPSELSTAKTVFILAAVVGCFAILWPRMFSPMLQSALQPQNVLDETAGCCDVMSDMDVNAIKILTEMCGRILTRHDELDPKFVLDFEHGKMNKEVVNTCKKEVLNTCGIDITTFLAEQVGLGQTYRQILNNIKQFNNSVCLKQNFGIERGLLGAARHWSHAPLKNLRQERPPHMRPDLINAALRERGRAIPPLNVVPRVMEGRPGPIPGMRPPMGGAGHVVPAPKSQGVMGIIMPLYTIGIVVIFVYTMMKLLMRRQSDIESVNEFQPDPNFRRYVFADQHGDQNGANKRRYDQPTKLGEIEMIMLRRRLQETEAAMERIVNRIGKVPFKSQYDEQGENGVHLEPKREEGDHESASVKVVNMEMTASFEGGKPWPGSRPSTPTSRSRPPSRPPTPLEREISTIPLPQDAQEIYLEGALPSQSQLLVAESETEAHKVEEDETGENGATEEAPVMEEEKVTMQAAPKAEENETASKEVEMSEDTVADTSPKELKKSLRFDFDEVNSKRQWEEDEGLLNSDANMSPTEEEINLEIQRALENLNFEAISDRNKVDSLFEKLSQFSPSEQEYLQKEVDSIIEDAVECIQLEHRAGSIADEEEYDLEKGGTQEETDEDVEEDIRDALKESKKMRKAVHEQVEELKSSLAPGLEQKVSAGSSPAVSSLGPGYVPPSKTEIQSPTNAMEEEEFVEEEEYLEEEEPEEEMDEEEEEVTDEEVEYEEDETEIEKENNSSDLQTGKSSDQVIKTVTQEKAVNLQVDEEDEDGEVDEEEVDEEIEEEEVEEEEEIEEEEEENDEVESEESNVVGVNVSGAVGRKDTKEI